MDERTGCISKPVEHRNLQKSIVVTGIPRGGTTLLGSLLCRLENSYCISEPMAIEEHLHLSATPEEFLVRTGAYLAEQRERILKTGRAMNRVARDGRPVTNYFRRIGTNAVVSEYVDAEEPVSILDENFTLAVKHNAHFLSILPELCAAPDFDVIGIIRHPIPTILSWRSLNLPISSGRLPSGEKFWPELSKIANCDIDVLVKQVLIYELIVTRLLDFFDRIHVLCYESLVHDPELLALVLGQRYNESTIFQSHNRNREYNWQEVNKIRSVLESSAPNSIRLYSMDDLDSPFISSRTPLKYFGSIPPKEG